ncbi:hypothetical protein ACJOMK_06920, partial [Mycoplasmopsis synoviae]
LFPPFVWTQQSIILPPPIDRPLPNPTASTKATEKSEFKLQNFIMPPPQAPPPTTAQTSPTAPASPTLRVPMAEDSAEQRPASVAPQPPQPPT